MKAEKVYICNYCFEQVLEKTAIKNNFKCSCGAGELTLQGVFEVHEVDINL